MALGLYPTWTPHGPTPTNTQRTPHGPPERWTCELTCQCGTAATAETACEASCSLAGIDLASAEGQSCVSTCAANLPLNCTCTTTRIGTQVSTFFGTCG